MTDDTPLYGTDDAPNPNAFTSVNRTRLGPLGDEVVNEKRSKTDPDTMTETEEEVIGTCQCGRTEVVIDKLYKCVNCKYRACEKCHIEIAQKIYCSDCVLASYGIGRKAYKALYLLDEGVHTIDDLVETDTIEDEIISVRIDNAANTLLDHGYVHTEDDQDAGTDDLEEEQALSPEGREALHIADDIFGGDPDVQTLKEEVKLQKIANGYTES